ncbi:MAG: c-type cytochrome [Xanthomonadales bacterium]|nr:c-type cytochrome [Xanthomonadales bacterium]NIN58958.1 c-type cytochrome [Xanthomonadales bacterium]NIO14594.1 c-type cytochrome [Xanthomonadales bacterium]NIP11351.1 c-type cytochrome [Xanthomonadales bacterium]NIP75321.1 c-type cytochrome [Xanthomonadales bacterium]
MKSLCITLLLAAVSLSAPAMAGDAAAGKSKAAVCAGCHGPAGISSNPLWPNLAGQQEMYLVKQMKAFRDGERKDPVMAPMAASLSDGDIADLAAYYAGLK